MNHQVYIINEFLNTAIVKCDMHRSKEFYDDLEFIVTEWEEEEERRPADKLQNKIRQAVIEFCQESRGGRKPKPNDLSSEDETQCLLEGYFPRGRS